MLILQSRDRTTNITDESVKSRYNALHVSQSYVGEINYVFFLLLFVRHIYKWLHQISLMSRGLKVPVL